MCDLSGCVRSALCLLSLQIGAGYAVPFALSPSHNYPTSPPTLEITELPFNSLFITFSVSTPFARSLGISQGLFLGRLTNRYIFFRTPPC